MGGRGGPRGMPGNKPGAGPRPTGEKRPRKQRFQGFARRRMEPTERVEHAVEVCPDCGTRLSGGWTHRTREVIDIPESAVRVTEHAVIARECPVLRDIRDLKALYPKDARLSRWASAVKELYTKAREFSHTNVRKRSVAQRRLEHRLLALCRPYATDPSAVQAKRSSSRARSRAPGATKARESSAQPDQRWHALCAGPRARRTWRAQPPHRSSRTGTRGPTAAFIAEHRLLAAGLVPAIRTRKHRPVSGAGDAGRAGAPASLAGGWRAVHQGACSCS